MEVKVLSCSEETLGKKQLPLTFLESERKKMSKLKEAPVRAITVKSGDRDQFTCN